MSNAISLSDSLTFGASLQNLSSSLVAHAEEKVSQSLGEDIANYTALEKRAMVMVEALRLTSGFDLAAVITRGKLIQQIEQESLVSVHPGRYQTLTAMAQEQGISVGELSDTRALYNIVFPYIESIGMSVAELWGSIGKSVFREMVPALVSLITGQDPTHTSVRESVTQLINNATASLIAEGEMSQEDPSDPEEIEARNERVRSRTVRDLLTLGSTSPARQVRATLRPSRTAPVGAILMAPFDENGILESDAYLVMKLQGQDQLDMAKRLMGSHMISTTVNTRNNSGAEEHVSAIRRLIG